MLTKLTALELQEKQKEITVLATNQEYKKSSQERFDSHFLLMVIWLNPIVPGGGVKSARASDFFL